MKRMEKVKKSVAHINSNKSLKEKDLFCHGGGHCQTLNKKLTYKKVPESDRQQLLDLIDTVIKGLHNSDYFVPYAQWELDSMFDEVNYAYLYGAYDGDKLVGMMQLYVSQKMVADMKEACGLSEYKVCELGGALILREYRGLGVAVHLGLMLWNLAKELGFDYMIAAAHPDNKSSWKTLDRVSDCLKEVTLPDGSLRKLYVRKLH